MCCSKLDGGLGFKNLESFNLALLAKQWWRVIHNEESLSFKVLKGWYFPSISLMKALKKSNSSFIWPQYVRERKSGRRGLCLEGRRGQ